MNKKEYDKFIRLLDAEDKDRSLTFILELLQTGKKVKEVYEDFLIPSLANFYCTEGDDICIWREHVRTSIVRTILESSYQFIIRDRVKTSDMRVLTVCPQEEYHEIGAIIASHYFALAGFNSTYVGANTPNETIISAIKALKPHYIAISVTNYYNIVVTKKLIDMIRKEFPELKIIIGGQAFSHPGAKEQISYDLILSSLSDILGLKNEVSK